MKQTGTVVAVARDNAHRFSKQVVSEIVVIVGHGVQGDAHAGEKVQHLSRMKRNPETPNLRQVHLFHQELLDELADHGVVVKPGEMGENITTRGIKLLDLPEGTRLYVGDEVVIRITGLRNPCYQIDDFQPGLLARMVTKHPDGTIERKAGVMSVVEHGGVVHAGDVIRVEFPSGAPIPLQPV